MQSRPNLTFMALSCLLVFQPFTAHAQAASFPKSIPNLLARWEPSQPGGAYADTAKTVPAITEGASVAVIADLSGNKYDMVQPTAANKGVYKTAGSFAPGCVRFNGTSDTYSAGSPAAFNALASGGYTVFLVYEEITGQGVYGSVLSKQPGGSGAFSFLTLGGGAQFARYDSTMSAGVFTPAGTVALNTPSFLTYQFAPINLNAGTPLAVFGTELLRTNEATIYDVAQEGDEWFPANNVRLGSNDTPSFFMKGDIAAVVIYSRALQTLEIAQVETYLSRRYHLPVSGGAPPTPPVPSRVILTATGNSIMAGYLTQSSSEFKQAEAQLSWQPYLIYNEAIGGQHTTEMTVCAHQREDKFIMPGLVNALFAWEGSNDINENALTDPATAGEKAYTDMVAYLTARRAAGFTPIFAFTVLPRGTSSQYEAQRQIHNTLMKSDFTAPVPGYPGIYAANAGVTYADYLIDIGSDATIGTPGAQFQPAYFYSDTVHLNQAGAKYAATNYFAPAFNLVYDDYGLSLPGAP